MVAESLNSATAIRWNERIHALIGRFRLHGLGEDEILEELAAQVTFDDHTARSFHRLIGSKPLDRLSRQALADLYEVLADSACALSQGNP